MELVQNKPQGRHYWCKYYLQVCEVTRPVLIVVVSYMRFVPRGWYIFLYQTGKLFSPEPDLHFACFPNTEICQLHHVEWTRGRGIGQGSEGAAVSCSNPWIFDVCKFVTGICSYSLLVHEVCPMSWIPVVVGNYST